MSYLGELAAEESSVTAPVDALTPLVHTETHPGWAQNTEFGFNDGTCANAQRTRFRPMGYCEEKHEESSRWRCDGTEAVADKWDAAGCDNDAKKDDKAIFPSCGVKYGKYDIAEVDTCRLSSQSDDQKWIKRTGEDKDVEEECTQIDLATEDSVFECMEACKTNAQGGGDCDRVTYNPTSKACSGVDNECTDGTDADGLIAATDGSEQIWKVGCGSADPLPGGVVQYYNKSGGNLSAPDCVATEDMQADEHFFLFDKCVNEGDHSYATYCVSDKVIHSRWLDKTDCSGDPAYSWEFTADTCTLAESNNKSYNVRWWGACGAGATPVAAGYGGESDTCKMGTPVDPACTCDSGVGIIDGEWEEGTCGTVVAEHGCANVNEHFANDGKDDAALWNTNCCGESAASSAGTQLALVSTLVAFFLRKLF